jgi:DNA-binding FrmR family transcriptional regulator
MSVAISSPGGYSQAMDSKLHFHATHPAIIKRLKRAEGHLRSITAMIEDGRACLEVAQQLQAVEKAIVQAKKTLIQDHIDHCLEAATDARPRQRADSIREFKEITKYL